MKRWIKRSFFLGSLVFFTTPIVRAKDVVYKKHTVVDFSEDTIEGDLSKPDAQYLESRKRLRHEHLIQVKKSFRQEILQSLRLF